MGDFAGVLTAHYYLMDCFAGPMGVRKRNLPRLYNTPGGITDDKCILQLAVTGLLIVAQECLKVSDVDRHRIGHLRDCPTLASFQGPCVLVPDNMPAINE